MYLEMKKPRHDCDEAGLDAIPQSVYFILHLGHLRQAGLGNLDPSAILRTLQGFASLGKTVLAELTAVQLVRDAESFVAFRGVAVHSEVRVVMQEASEDGDAVRSVHPRIGDVRMPHLVDHRVRDDLLVGVLRDDREITLVPLRGVFATFRGPTTPVRRRTLKLPLHVRKVERLNGRQPLLQLNTVHADYSIKRTSPFHAWAGSDLRT
jgi:hypothetical protein